MVCSRERQGIFCIEGDPGGVCPMREGSSIDDCDMLCGNLGLLRGEAAGLLLCKLFFRLKQVIKI